MSGQLAFVCQETNCVYKKNLEPAEDIGLLHTHEKQLQIEFPKDAMTTDDNLMVVFDLHHPPLLKPVIQKHAVWFSKSLVTAVHALHDVNLAHLDIR